MSSSIVQLRAALERRWQGAVPHAIAPARAGTPSGIAVLDDLLGPSGIPIGRLTEIFGAPSSGKTTLALAALAACTQGGGIGAYIDPQRTFFAPVAEAAGVDLRRLVVVRPRAAAAARRAADALVRGGACAVVVLDCSGSPAALQTHHCARLAAQAEKTGTALVIVSNGDVQAVASFASLRLHAHGLAPLWEEGGDGAGRLAGCVTSVDVAKSRAIAPGRSVRVALTHDTYGAVDAVHGAVEFIRPPRALH